MSNRSLAALLIAAILAGGCAGAAPEIRTESPRAAVAAEDLNPEITPPPVQVEVAANLPAVDAPDGFITQASARDTAIAAMQKRQWGGRLVLTALTFDTANKMWEAEFRTDGRIPGRPRSHPYEHLSDDPVQRRRLEHSWVTVTTHLTMALDGVTGEIRGGGYRGGKAQPDRPDLEHYRGVIVTGGEVLTLRLIRADGTATGRDLEVWVPNDLLGAGLSLWQLRYGHGRTVDIWGLTASPGVVLAHRIAMADPPPESLLAAPLAGALPLYPEAYIHHSDENTTVFLAPGADLAQARAWYAGRLPAYGWNPAAAADTYESAAWEKVRLELATEESGVKVTFTHIRQ